MTLQQAKDFLTKEINYVGLAFHPDTDFQDYKGLYNAQTAKECNDKLAECFDAFDEANEDIYQFCLDQL